MDAFWLYLHILLLVFWVGTDVGVFIAAKWSERATLSMETRQTVLQLGMVLDRLPRSALTLIIPSGCQLAVASGWLDIPAQYLLGMWAFAAIWMAILWRGFLSADPKTQEQSAKINWLLNLILALAVSGTGMMLLLQGEIADWLAERGAASGPQEAGRSAVSLSSAQQWTDDWLRLRRERPGAEGDAHARPPGNDEEVIHW